MLQGHFQTGTQQQQQQQGETSAPAPSSLLAKRLQSRRSEAAAAGGSPVTQVPNLALSLQVSEDVSLGGVEPVQPAHSAPLHAPQPLHTTTQPPPESLTSDTLECAASLQHHLFQNLIPTQPPQPLRPASRGFMLPTCSDTGLNASPLPDLNLFMTSAAAANAAAEAVLGGDEADSSASSLFCAGLGTREELEAAAAAQVKYASNQGEFVWGCCCCFVCVSWVACCFVLLSCGE